MNDKVDLASLIASLGSDEGVVKQASEQVAPQTTQSDVSDTAKDLEKILTKQANEVNTEMSNAKQKGQAIADSVMALVKQAMDGSEGANRVIEQTTAQAAQSSAGIAETPREGNSITQTLQGLVANGIAQGAVRADALDEHVDSGRDEGHGGNTTMHSSDENEIEADENEEAAEDDEVEKTAALITLVDNGVDFDTAVSLIKQAEEEILADEEEFTKQAAVAALLNEGMDIEYAVELVKVAMELDPELVKEAGKAGAVRKAVSNAKVQGAGMLEAAKQKLYKGDAAYFNIAGRKKIYGDAAKAKQQVIKADRDVELANLLGNGKSGIENFVREQGIKGKAIAKQVGAGIRHGAQVYGPAAAIAGGAAGTVGGGVYLATREKQAAAIEYLLGEGYSVAQALDILDNQ